MFFIFFCKPTTLLNYKTKICRTFYLNAQVYHHNRNQNSLKTSPVWQTGTQLSVHNVTCKSTFQSHRRGVFLRRDDRQSIGLSLSEPETIQCVERSYVTRHNSRRRRRVVAIHLSKGTYNLIDQQEQRHRAVGAQSTMACASNSSGFG